MAHTPVPVDLINERFSTVIEPLDELITYLHAYANTVTQSMACASLATAAGYIDSARSLLTTEAAS